MRKNQLFGHQVRRYVCLLICRLKSVTMEPVLISCDNPRETGCIVGCGLQKILPDVRTLLPPDSCQDPRQNFVVHDGCSIQQTESVDMSPNQFLLLQLGHEQFIHVDPPERDVLAKSSVVELVGHPLFSSSSTDIRRSCFEPIMSIQTSIHGS